MYFKKRVHKLIQKLLCKKCSLLRVLKVGILTNMHVYCKVKWLLLTISKS